ncbi:hypothetical protein FSP39_020850 [Pinctada imbricata]|uniref:Uncharacterized protein n=1 Tax=Pinctada imbricata TaxID=66713 RepID=A0AA88XTV9_PINIB|nr:hypothetical protein FSP39_020850 [Pinctada imbricata]
MTSSEIEPGQRTKDHLYNIIDSAEPWKGRMLFTGPDAIRDHQVKVDDEHRQVGIGSMSVEWTSEANYLWRAAPGTPFPRPRSTKVGEVGWQIPRRSDWTVTRSGRQIILGDFRQECENRNSHLYQNPWYPGPEDEILPNTDAALVMNVYRPKTVPANAGRRSNRSTSGRISRHWSATQATPTTDYYNQPHTKRRYGIKCLVL